MTDTVPAPAEGPVTLTGLIDELVVPPEPVPIPLTPETAGWWVLAVLLVTGVTVGVWAGVRSWRAGAYRREARAALSACGDDPAAIAAVLRRTALAAYPRRQVAGLTGTEWVDFLHDTGGFPRALGPALLRAPYAPAGDSPVPDLHSAADAWLRRHRGPA